MATGVLDHQLLFCNNYNNSNNYNLPDNFFQFPMWDIAVTKASTNGPCPPRLTARVSKFGQNLLNNSRKLSCSNRKHKCKYVIVGPKFDRYFESGIIRRTKGQFVSVSLSKCMCV